MNESLERTIERLEEELKETKRELKLLYVERNNVWKDYRNVENALCQAETDLDEKDCIIRELEEQIFDLENRD